MSKKVSIVMAYYNRLEVLKVTLRTISKTRYGNVEIIIVDDGSDDSQRCEKLQGYCGLDIKILRVDKKEKTWINSCIPFNKGFQQATGEIILIQNPECLYIGDVISYVVNNLDDNNYLTFSCYSVNAPITAQLHKIDGDILDYIDKIAAVVEPHMKLHIPISHFLGWYNHPTVRPCAYHFCSAMTKKNIDELGGFDERYSLGCSYDDNELLTRIKRKRLLVKIVPPESKTYVVHQFHSVITDSRICKSANLQKNRKLYHTVTLKETGWKANI